MVWWEKMRAHEGSECDNERKKKKSNRW